MQSQASGKNDDLQARVRVSNPNWNLTLKRKKKDNGENIDRKTDLEQYENKSTYI